MSYQIENINKEIENIKKYKIKILELKSSIFKIKIHYRDSRIDLSSRKEKE